MRETLIRIAAAIAVAALIAVAAFGTFATHYFDSKGLDPHPYPLRGVTLRPPAERNGITFYGKLQLDVYIDAEGVVDHVDVQQSGLPQGLRDEAVRAFSEVRWEPGRKWGIRVKSVKRIEIDLLPPPGLEGPAPMPQRP